MNNPINFSFTLFVPALFNHAHLLLLASDGGVPMWISKAVNLAIFLALLYWLLRKPMREFFATRLAQVRQTLDRARQERDAAQAKMDELNARLNRLGSELAEIKAQGQREAAAERERAQAEAQHDAEKIRAGAQREIEVAKQVAMADLREFAATQAVDLAEQMIRRELKPEDDARLLQRVTDEMTRVA